MLPTQEPTPQREGSCGKGSRQRERGAREPVDRPGLQRALSGRAAVNSAPRGHCGPEAHLGRPGQRGEATPPHVSRTPHLVRMNDGVHVPRASRDRRGARSEGGDRRALGEESRRGRCTAGREPALGWRGRGQVPVTGAPGAQGAAGPTALSQHRYDRSRPPSVSDREFFRFCREKIALKNF